MFVFNSTLFCLFLQLLASHQQELDDLEERLHNDRVRQTLTLRDQLAQRRRRRLDKLRHKQESEMTREVLEQQKEVEDIRLKQVLHPEGLSQCTEETRKNRKCFI